eukprot:4906535-Prymnesium_polylepis.1
MAKWPRSRPIAWPCSGARPRLASSRAGEVLLFAPAAPEHPAVRGAPWPCARRICAAPCRCDPIARSPFERG